MSPSRPGPRPFLLLCRITLAAVVLNVISGASVRLSDSGLGCPDWPTCSQHHLTPPLRLHPIIEFGNRAVVFVLVVACAATFVASWFRRPARRDLRWLSGGLILGVLGEAVLGAVVVYSDLNAYVVVCHFLVGMALLAVAVELTLRADHAPGRGTVSVDARSVWLTRAVLALTVLILAAGASTTGAGPHAGGKGAKRIPIGLEDMTRIHAEIVLATGVVLLVLLWSLWRADAPAHVQEAGKLLLGIMAAQGVIGYVQFFTHLPALLVGVHVFGASMVWAVVLWFHHGISDHRPEPPDASLPAIPSRPAGMATAPGPSARAPEPVGAPAGSRNRA